RRFMPYTSRVVERGSSHSFIAKARPPTVTMPRIKVNYTQIKSFLNLVLIPHMGCFCLFCQHVVFICLFSSHPLSDLNISFSFCQVDNNVTRHLDGTLKRDDWDILILHYLGLDHIRHISGPHSSLIGPKLMEMDDIIKKIHSSLISKESEGTLPNLLVLCGDHGMSETGSHGGSSEPEINTPLVLISPTFRRKSGFEKLDVLEQVDLTPTLALGLGLPISKNSVGHLIPAVFEEFREQLRLLQINGHQLSRLLQDSNPTFHKEDGYEQFRVAEKSHGSWMKLYLDGNRSEVLSNMGKKVLRQYLEALKAMSSALSKHLGKYDMYSMIMGMIFILGWNTVGLGLLRPAAPDRLNLLRGREVNISIYSSELNVVNNQTSKHGLERYTSNETKKYTCCLGSALLGSDWTLSQLDALLLIGTMGHTLSLRSSSFIEEEHQTWYFLLNTLCLAIFQDVEGPLLPSSTEKGPSFSPALELGMSLGSEKWLALATPLLTLTCCHLLRSLNQTGVQWAHLPDFGHRLNSGDHKAFLSLLVAVSLVLIFLLIQHHCSLVSKIALALGLLRVYSYRAAVGNVLFPWQHRSRSISKGTVEAQFVYVFVLGILFTGLKDLLRLQVMSSAVESRRLKSRGLWEVYSGMVLLVALLFRAHNLPTLACCLLIQTIMAQFIWKKLHYDAAQTTIMHYWFGQAFFYFQGNSNNIGTVDISVGFVGLESYVEAPAVFLTTLSTYAGPLLWACHLLCFLSSQRDRAVMGLGHGSYCFALLRSIPAVFYVVLVTLLRYHLFIWSVFSPKLLYEAMHTLITTAVCLFFTFMDQERSARP
uniref:Phosphatidylinositol glycan anchor biosynthesis class G (EMM blood group) n=1 Tax=Cyprinus carpio carpio TaxID=630221 RepID=A0A9J8A461_CYPCA